jgi:hypothetical protein
MEDLKIKGTDRTPKIDSDYKAGVLEFSGRFIPEDAEGTMAPILNWLRAYAENPQKTTTINLYIEYFNTVNSKSILLFFKAAEAIKNTKINWYYEQGDEDMLELGEDFESILSIPFSLIEVGKEEWKTRMPF